MTLKGLRLAGAKSWTRTILIQTIMLSISVFCGACSYLLASQVANKVFLAPTDGRTGRERERARKREGDREREREIYIYIYSGVIIWAKFGLLRCYYLGQVRFFFTKHCLSKNTIKIGVSALFFRQTLRAQI